MPLGYIYWLLMILWLLFGLWWHWPARSGEAPPGPAAYGLLGGNLLLFVLLFILGWRVFGFIVT